ncbi:glycosyltransferase family 2 protein [Mucilaginibacter myungsuensis]|uniref:Glycosyltransferase family 2 protein n=1 Tax=Mucilaginibacter myungsuensis TaxID=649104 RepID=A0A929KWS6_9SPHI|nr:glycosyltransferase family 2 protein [Mucilaginibacter myungsuensis]MBE9660344.1 glycosyltransferase family 2 protein [Mucilaginibacter myungsuensis]MDN3600386.1 glycosyltransferase family 2 protein [Mucilaginibacter myungsuensis]
MKKISIVIPSFNEASNINELVQRLTAALKDVPYIYEVIFVDDGSSDNTLETLKAVSEQNANLYYLELSRNFGHQNALKAGYDYADGDCIISMDGDLQHPPELIPQFLQKWEEGYDVVYTTREYHDEATYFKTKSSEIFYNMINSLSDTKLEKGTADFRLIDRKVANVLNQLNENGLFMRGLIKWLGFKQYAINYKAEPRFSGKSKYTVKKMVRFAVEGVTAFSVRPLNIAIGIGAFFSAASLLYIPYIAWTFAYGHESPGWASVIATVVFFGGMQLMVLGIIGLYLGKLFMQAKQRPNYIVRSTNLIKLNNDTAKL